jgi:hypothetical protein
MMRSDGWQICQRRLGHQSETREGSKDSKNKGCVHKLIPREFGFKPGTTSSWPNQSKCDGRTVQLYSGEGGDHPEESPRTQARNDSYWNLCAQGLDCFDNWPKVVTPKDRKLLGDGIRKHRKQARTGSNSFPALHLLPHKSAEPVKMAAFFPLA